MGHFIPLAWQEVRLVAFDGFGRYTIDSNKVSEQGVFNLNYKTRESDLGNLATADNSPYFVVLANENIQLKR